MRKQNIKYLLFILISVMVSCDFTGGKLKKHEETFEIDGDNEILAVNASKYGAKYPETFVYIPNRRGVRGEFCLDRSNLELWINPLAGKSFDYNDRNWSNRDDHTMVFDRIKLPQFSLNNFDSCDYDPFLSKLYYKDNAINFSQVYDEPCIIVWFDKASHIDFKVNAEVVNKDAKSLVVKTIDRGREFEYSIFLGKGDGEITHQSHIDKNRSVYARANMAARQYIVISGELRTEQISEVAKRISEKPIDEILARNETLINKDLENGQFLLKNKYSVMQKLLDKNRRVALSLQEFKSMMRTTPTYIYYLYWLRDGGKNTSYMAYSGWTEPLKDNVKMALLNPNISYNEPKGKFFGQLMGGPITKWEEDGLFFVVWPAFTHWTQTGDRTFCEGIYMENMLAGLKWLEDFCFDEEMGLFGRYYANETPFKGSVDFGFDGATGAPTDKWEIKYKGQNVVRTYDMYINLYMYNVYTMLSAMNSGQLADELLAKAAKLEHHMEPFYSFSENIPSYGYVETEDGKKQLISFEELDDTDFIWPTSIAMFHPFYPEQDISMRETVYNYVRANPKGHFICAYNTMLTGMDTEIFSEDSIIDALEYLVPQSVRPGKYKPMPYTIPEMVDEVDGHPFHDVRPIVYSIAPWLSAITNTGLRRLPYGIALRANKSLEQLKNYHYQQGLLNVKFEGIGQINTISVNGSELKNSYQVPINLIEQGENEIEVKQNENVTSNNILVSSTVQLNSIEIATEEIIYNVGCFGHNVIAFKNLSKGVLVKTKEGDILETEQQQVKQFTYIKFNGRGEMLITLK